MPRQNSHSRIEGLWRQWHRDGGRTLTPCIRCYRPVMLLDPDVSFPTNFLQLENRNASCTLFCLQDLIAVAHNLLSHRLNGTHIITSLCSAENEKRWTYVLLNGPMPCWTDQLVLHVWQDAKQNATSTFWIYVPFLLSPFVAKIVWAKETL
jgi:hypothetical protein